MEGVIMARTPVFGGNWKMNHTVQMAEEFLQYFINCDFSAECEVILFPSFTNLHLMQKYLRGTSVQYGAQNFYYEEAGAFTGEVSLNMLSSLGCKHVLTGHSERRQIFGETDDLVNKKTLQAIQHNLTPMICVGESLDEREKNLTRTRVREQVKVALQGVTKQDIGKLIFAYEPIWAIGTGVNASEVDAKEGCGTVREVVADEFGSHSADQVRVLYGGSVKPNNISSYMDQDGIDGGLVGGASLKPTDFYELIRNGIKAK